MLNELFADPDFLEVLATHLPSMLEEAHARHRDLDGLNQNVGEDRESILKCVINNYCLEKKGFVLFLKLSRETKGFDWLNLTNQMMLAVKTQTGLGAIKYDHASGEENQKQARKNFLARPTLLMSFVAKDKKITAIELYFIPESAIRTHLKTHGKKKLLKVRKGDSKGICLGRIASLVKNRNVLKLEIPWNAPPLNKMRDDFWEEVYSERNKKPLVIAKSQVA